MKIFISFPESPKQFLALSRFLINQNQQYLNFCVVKNVSEETEISKFHFRTTLATSKSKTIFLRFNLYKRFHKLAIIFVRHSGFLQVILGNILDATSKEFFYLDAKNKIILVDDGLLTLSLGELVLKSNKIDNYLFYTIYEDLLSPRLHILKDESMHLFSSIYPKYDKKVLGVFGSPLVESGFISVHEYESMLLKVMLLNNCNSINYYMHRRESVKFNAKNIQEFKNLNQNSLELICELQTIPMTWWSVYSSALVELKLLNIPKLIYTYTPIYGVTEMNHPYLSSIGIQTVETVYKVYSDLEFRRV